MAGKSARSAIGAVQFHGTHCTVNGVRLHYLDFRGGSDKRPILLLPGITSPAATWVFVAERLAADRRVVVADIRGRGLSDNRAGLGYSLDDYVADALGMMQAARLEQPVILGHSMGARIGVRLAARHPAALSALIMADPPLTGPGRAPYPTPLDSYLTAHAAASTGATIAEFRAFNPTWTDQQISLRLQWLPTCSLEAITETYDYFHSEDIHADLPQVVCPALLIRATKARVVTEEGATEIQSLMPHLAIADVSAGHMIPWDNLPDFLASIWSFTASEPNGLAAK